MISFHSFFLVCLCSSALLCVAHSPSGCPCPGERGPWLQIFRDIPLLCGALPARSTSPVAILSAVSLHASWSCSLHLGAVQGLLPQRAPCSLLLLKPCSGCAQNIFEKQALKNCWHVHLVLNSTFNVITT